MVVLGNVNAYSLHWNVYCGERIDKMGLERLMNAHDLILNQESGKATRITTGSLAKRVQAVYRRQD